jgi:hypothetical protein
MRKYVNGFFSPIQFVIVTKPFAAALQRPARGSSPFFRAGLSPAIS